MGRKSQWMQRACLLSVLLGVSACPSEHPTQIVLAVGSDLAIPQQIDSLRIVADNAAQSFERRYSLDPRAVAAVRLPASLAFSPGKAEDAVLMLRVEGLLGEATAVVRRASVGWLEGRQLLLRIDLLRECAFDGDSCSDEQTCSAAGCVAVDIDPRTLPSYTEEVALRPLPDGGTPIDDSGPADAGMAEDSAGPPDAPTSDGSATDGGGPPTSFCSVDRWCWAHPLPQGNTLQGVWGAADGTLVAVGDAGTVLRFDGVNWTRQATTSTNALRAVWGASPSAIYAVGNGGEVLHYNGDRWTAEQVAQAALRSIWGVGADQGQALRLFAVGDEGGVYRYVEGRWRADPAAYLAGSRLYGVWAPSADEAYAVGQNGTLLRFNGQSWSRLESGTSSNLYTVWGAGGTLYVGDELGVLRYTSDSGGSGSGLQRMASFGARVTAIHGSTAGNIYAVLDSGQVLHYDGNQPGDWRVLPGSTSNPGLTSVWVSGDGFHAVGNAGVILAGSPDAMQPESKIAAAGHLHSIWGPSDSEVYVVGQSGTVLRYHEQRWQPFVSPSPVDLHAVWGDGRGSLFVAGASGVIARHDGEQWRDERGGSGLLRDLDGHVGSTGLRLYAVGEQGIYQRQQGGVWSREAEASPLRAVSLDPQHQLVVAVGDAGRIWQRRADQPWQLIPSPTNVTLYDVWVGAADEAYAVGAEETILRYDGSRWRPESTPASFDLWAVWGTPSGARYAAGARHATSKVLRRTVSGTWVEERTEVSERHVRALWGQDTIRAVGNFGSVLSKAP